jgi:shikimate kinase
MSVYHISGPSGSGKSYVGRELGNRGFRVIETDFEPGLASWVNKESGKKVIELPPQPYPKEWVETHGWLWDAMKFNELVDETDDKPVFFVGGAHNQKDFYELFNKRFGLYVDTPTLISRVQPREPERWADGSAELQGLIDWNERSKDYERSSGAILIDSSVPVELVADTILKHIQQTN